MFYAFKASIGFIRLIRLAIIKLEDRPISRAKPSIGGKLIGLNEKLKPVDKALPISIFAIIETTTSSKEAITNEMRHCIKEWK